MLFNHFKKFLTVLVLVRVVIIVHMSLGGEISKLMGRFEEQQTNLKFLVKSGLTPAKSFRALKHIFGDSTMSLSSVQKWHKKFKQRLQAVADQPRPGRPKSGHSEDNIILVRALVDQDRRKTVRKIAEESALGVSTVFRILRHDLQMRLVNAKFVPRLLSDEQKLFRKCLCEENLFRFLDEENFMARIVTGDETWVSVFEPETKIESRQWQEKGEQRPQKAMKSRSRKKSMLTVFFDIDGIVLIQFTRPPHTIDSDSYCATLSLLKERIRKKRPHLWTNPETKFLLHHDNAPAHTATRTLAKIGQWGMEMVPHPPPLQARSGAL